LFGDILALGNGDLVVIYGLMILVLGILLVYWRPLLSTTVDQDLARVEGVAVPATRLLLMLLLALLITGAIRTVGVLLITSLLVMPAAGARRLARTPEQMAGFASLIGLVAVTLGLTLSWHADTPVGPSIVVAAAVLFGLTLLRKPTS
ncbi:MAG: hypothetical protein CL549_08620, partial [Alcanivorax sp.]|nr:hypothetical protein [Alcanivorax sp.]